MRQIMDEILYKMFSCGIEGKTFKAHYAAKPEEERDRLDRVAWRVWLTLQLRYRAKLTQVSHMFPVFNIQLESY